MKSEVRCKVRKTQDSFDRACDLGYAINFYSCTPQEMWLILPTDKPTLRLRLTSDGFEMLEEVITDEEYLIQVRNK